MSRLTVEAMRARLEAAARGRKRHDPDSIALAKAAMNANRALKAIAEITGISVSMLKKIRAGELHKNIAPDPEFKG